VLERYGAINLKTQTSLIVKSQSINPIIMKCLLFLVVLNCLTSLLALSQNDSICGILPLKNGMVFYSEVVVKEGASANQLYSKAKI